MVFKGHTGQRMTELRCRGTTVFSMNGVLISLILIKSLLGVLNNLKSWKVSQLNPNKSLLIIKIISRWVYRNKVRIITKQIVNTAWNLFNDSKIYKTVILAYILAQSSPSVVTEGLWRRYCIVPCGLFWMVSGRHIIITFCKKNACSFINIK